MQTQGIRQALSVQHPATGRVPAHQTWHAACPWCGAKNMEQTACGRELKQGSFSEMAKINEKLAGARPPVG